MGEPCKCKLKCFEKVTEEERQDFFEYWDLGTNEGKWDFHINQLINSAKQRCTNNKESYEKHDQRIQYRQEKSL